MTRGTWLTCLNRSSQRYSIASTATLSHTWHVNYQDDPVGYEQRLRDKLEPANLRATMAFAGLYQITSEMIRHAVIEKVRDFYWIDAEGNSALRGANQKRYQDEVLSLARKEFPASLKWLVQSKAITQAQADRLGVIQAHRNDLTHELVRYMVDVDADPDIELLGEAHAVLKDLHRFWIDIELSSGGFFLADGNVVDQFDEVDPDEIMPASLMLLRQCIEAYVDGLVTTEPSTESL